MAIAVFDKDTLLLPSRVRSMTGNYEVALSDYLTPYGFLFSSHAYFLGMLDYLNTPAERLKEGHHADFCDRFLYAHGVIVRHPRAWVERFMVLPTGILFEPNLLPPSRPAARIVMDSDVAAEQAAYDLIYGDTDAHSMYAALREKTTLITTSPLELKRDDFEKQGIPSFADFPFFKGKS